MEKFEEIAREKKIEFGHQISDFFTYHKKKSLSKIVFESLKIEENSHFESQNRGK